MNLKQFAIAFIKTVYAILYTIYITYKDYKQNKIVYDLEIGKSEESDKALETLCGSKMIDLELDEIRSIVEFFREKEGIPNVFHYLNEHGVVFLSVFYIHIKRWYGAAFISTTNRIIIRDKLPGFDDSLVVHEIQHAVQKIKYKRFGLKDRYNNFIASVWACAYQDFDRYYNLDFEQDAYRTQAEYNRFKNKRLQGGN